MASAPTARRARPAEHFAARFAAKEAVLKALGVPDGLRWHELEVVSASGGAPSLVLSGEAARAAGQRGAAGPPLAHPRRRDAAAVVVLEGELPVELPGHSPVVRA